MQRRSAVTAIVIAIAAVVGLVAWLWQTPVIDTPAHVLSAPPDSGPFGHAVALSDGRALVGFSVTDDVPRMSLFDAASGEALQAFIDPGTTPDADHLQALALDGDRAAMTVPYDDRDGHAVVFGVTDGAVLAIAAPPADTNFFGSSVALDGDVLAVGDAYHSVGENDGELLVGRVLLYDAASGDLLRALADPDPVDSGGFGLALALSGDRLMVGAPTHVSNRGDGRAYLFDTRDGALLRTFAPPEPDGRYRFGNAVAFLGDDVVICEVGVGYLFNAATGELLATFHDPNDGALRWFCTGSLAADGSRVLIGDRGEAHLFSGDGDLLATYANPDDDPSDDAYFGISVALEGTQALIGYGYSSGAAFVFEAEALDD